MIKPHAMPGHKPIFAKRPGDFAETNRRYNPLLSETSPIPMFHEPLDTPEARLNIAVLEQAIEDYIGILKMRAGVTKEPPVGIKSAAETAQAFASARDYLFTDEKACRLDTLCGMVGLDLDAVRDAIRREAAQYREKMRRGAVRAIVPVVRA